ESVFTSITSPSHSTLLSLPVFFFTSPPPPRSTLFPYTTLFRSKPLSAASDSRALKGSPRTIWRTKSSVRVAVKPRLAPRVLKRRSEEHTSELQSRFDLVCRLLLEKKNNTT